MRLNTLFFIKCFISFTETDKNDGPDLPLLLQVRRADPALSSRVGFGGFGSHQPSLRMKSIQDLHKLALLQDNAVLISSL